jgi:hypothetical protein
VLKLSSAYATALSCRDRVITSANTEAQAALASLDSRQRVKIREADAAGPSAAEVATERMAREVAAICQEARQLLENAGEEYTRQTPAADGAPDSAATAFAGVVMGIEDLRFRLIALAEAALQAGSTGKALLIAEAILSEKPTPIALAARVGDLLAATAAASLSESEAARLEALVTANATTAIAAQDKLLERKLASSIANNDWKKAADILATVRKVGREDLLRSPSWIGTLVSRPDTDDQEADGLLKLVEDWRKSAPADPQLAAALEDILERRLERAIGSGRWSEGSRVIEIVHKMNRDDLLRSPHWIGHVVSRQGEADESVEGLLAFVQRWHQEAMRDSQLNDLLRRLHVSVVAELASKGLWDAALKARKSALDAGGSPADLDGVFAACPIALWGYRTPERIVMPEARAPVGGAVISPSGSLIAHVTSGANPVLDLYDVGRASVTGSMQLPSTWLECAISFPAERSVWIWSRGTDDGWLIVLDDPTNPASWTHVDRPYNSSWGSGLGDAGGLSLTGDYASGILRLLGSVGEVEIDTTYGDLIGAGLSGRNGAVLFALFSSGKLYAWKPTGPIYEND